MINTYLPKKSISEGIRFFISILIFGCFSLSWAQNNLTAEQLFQKARETAFKQKEYPKAIELTKEALVKSPDYTDIRIFLGRLYTWSEKPKLAREEFEKALKSAPEYEDAYFAYGSLEFWNNNPTKTLSLANSGINYHPNSENLLLLKAKALKNLKRYPEATKTLNNLLNINPDFAEARLLREKLKELSSKNKIGVSYDFVYFDKRFDNPWHLASLEYGRQTGLGAVTARINYANRFKTNGTQFEIDAYPNISNTFNAYANAGISKKNGVFPQYRAGLSLYANLPAAFQTEAGFRLLVFNTETWIYTAGLSKYYKNFLFNIRTYLTPSNQAVSQSYSLNIRYYLAGPDDYLNLGLGTGISPDNSANNILYNNGTYKLKSTNISVGYRHSFNATNIIYLKTSFENQEYLKDVKGNQFTIGLGYFKLF